MITLEATLERVLERLEDINSAVWSRDEIITYIKNGYDSLTRETNCLFDITFVAEDIPYCGNHTAQWEEEFMTGPGWVVGGLFNFTGGAGNADAWEKQYIDNGVGPCDHTAFWESTLDHTFQDTFSATAQLPAETLEVDRVTFDNYRIDPHFSRDLGDHYKFYEYIQGPQRGYTLDKDGYFTIRKVPVPSESGTEYLHERAVSGVRVANSTATYGLLRSQTDDEFETSPDVRGTRGILRSFPTHIPIGTRGFPRRLYSDSKNFRVEYFRRGKDLDSNPFEVPDRFVKYVELYAMSLARERDGVGQDKKLSAHFLARYQEGVDRLKRRMQMVMKERIHRMGGGSIQSRWPDIARLPYHYPSVPGR